MTEAPTEPDIPKYARFTRRVQALAYDWMIQVAIVALTLFLATAAEGIGATRLIGITGATIFLLYDPVLVGWRGGTIGHAIRNLRVVDDWTQGNVSFLKSLARYAIKLLLGILSFLTMGTTQRHQAIHDLITGSTVRIRDETKASVQHYHVARAEFADGTMPSRLRRIVAILLYLVLGMVAALLATGILSETVITTECLDNDNACSTAEKVMLNAIGFGILVLCAAIIIMGWRGKLPGCRRKPH